ncbi:RNA cap guanine-N2 methyltransferase-domain-containing protein [Rhodocollybia butyracea]|uniref:Trimethylguanosine synthase n=1 Tax=Rhodocollybia butyracea TaxID=206335 RepID=A0A9P5PNC0_9AGAR|nr:RNA cap guanine-N2 methyltransferase-domain-containing protein [Rhodocollybia butyracea]
MGKRNGKRNSGFSGLARFAKQVSDSTQIEDEPPKKKQKISSSDPINPKYDMSGSVPSFTSIEDVPSHLRKCKFNDYAQRTRFFSLYSSPPGCLLDEEASQIADKCRCDTILDAFCGVGGNAIAFAKTCQRVIALDISPTRLALARHNAQIYGVADHIEFILADYVSFADAYLSSSSSRKIDVVFLSPPWVRGLGRLPINTPDISLSSIGPIHGAALFQLSRRISPNIAYYLPRNTDLEEVSALIKDETETAGIIEEYIQIEEEWMGSKLKALTCYFGGLVDGQEGLF